MRLSVILVAALAACSPIMGSEHVRAPAEIAGYNAEDPRIEMSVENGVLRISVVSYGNGCYRKGETEVKVTGRTVDVLPYDYRSTERACPDILLSFMHASSATFAASGPVTVRVHGLDRSGLFAGSSLGAAITVERTIEIP